MPDFAQPRLGHVLAHIRVQRSVLDVASSSLTFADASPVSTAASSVHEDTAFIDGLRKGAGDDLDLVLAAACAADYSRLDLGLATNDRLRRLARAYAGFRSQLVEPVYVHARYPTYSYARYEHELPSMGLSRVEWAERVKEQRAWYDADLRLIEERHRRAHARYMRRFNLAPDINPRPVVRHYVEPNFAWQMAKLLLPRRHF